MEVQTLEPIETVEIQEEAKRPRFQTYKGWYWPPTMRAPKGSYLKIKADGTVSYHNPECLRYSRPGSKPFKMSALNPRNDGSVKTFERLKASIEKRAGEQRGMKNIIGCPVMEGWQVAATDGHRALLTRGEGTGDKVPLFDTDKAHIVACLESEFHLLLKQSLIMADERSSMVRFIGTDGQLALSSTHEEPAGQRDGNDSGSFEGSIESNCETPWHIALNGNYVEPVCGTWPLAVWFTEPESAVMFEPLDSSWRYVVMPFKDEWKGTEFGAKPLETSDQEAQS